VQQQEDAGCAQAGCYFSWIPIVGCITFCANREAAEGARRGGARRALAPCATGLRLTRPLPTGSRRRKLAELSCKIAVAVFIINVIIVSTTA